MARALFVPAFFFLFFLGSAAEVRETPTASCRAARSVADPAIVWQVPDDADDRKHLAAWCSTVGPAVIDSGDSRLALSASPAGSLSSLVVASWNVHVGGGDLPGLITGLKRGDFTDGRRVTHFVLLLQEAHRAGREIPALGASSPDVPSRIDPDPPVEARADITAIARRFGLALYYVPSMRNGSDDDVSRREDRGNAILSTLPLSSFTAIELPFARQRRVAISAVVTGGDEAGRPWQLAVSSAHLDATTNWGGLRLFAAGLRAKQARALAEALENETRPLVLGSDLNTWWAGRNEDAFLSLERIFQPGASGGRTLDYMFLRLPSGVSANVHVLDDRLGSDHAPLVANFHPLTLSSAFADTRSARGSGGPAVAVHEVHD